MAVGRFIGVLCLLALARAAFGQGDHATIRGTVTDTDGMALADAQIQVTNRETGARFQATSAANGDYTLAQLSAGTYEMAVGSPGLQMYRQANIALAAAQTIRIDPRLADFTSLNTLGEDRAFYASLFTPHPAPGGPTPRTDSGKPDLSGVWYGQRVVESGKPVMTPWAAALTKKRQDDKWKDYPGSRCLPNGVTLMGQAFPYRLLQTPTLLVMLFEDDVPRQIYLDGRSHPKDFSPTFTGHSIGKWEGDTLVIDTVGFNDKTWIDSQGRPHTEKMHVTERIRRPDLGHLEIEITIEDPDAYTQPWVMKRASELAPHEDVGEFICTENNQDVEHLVGK